MESKTIITKAVEMESAVKSLGPERFAENATCLGIKATSTDPTTDGTILTSCAVLKMSYGFYQVTGVGPTEQTARTDCMIKINALLSQQLGLAQPYRHSLPVDDEDKDDFLNDLRVVLDLARFSRKRTTAGLKLLQHFVAENPTVAGSPGKRLQETTKILGGLVGYECQPRNGVHVTKCVFLGYCSTGLGRNIKESKSHAAGEMLYLLKQTVGLRVVERRDGRPCLHLPAVDKFKVKALKYFLTAPRECVSPEDRLREIATVVDDALECHVFRSDTSVLVEYAMSACKASVTGADEPSCKRRCQVEMLLELHEWCGFDLATDNETVGKSYENPSENCPRPDERCEETKPVQNVKVAGRISDVARLSEGTVKRTVKVLKNDNVIVPNNDKERHVNSGRSSDDVDGQDDETDSSGRLAEDSAEPEVSSGALPAAEPTFKNNVVANECVPPTPYGSDVVPPSRRPGIKVPGSLSALSPPFEYDSGRQAAATTTSHVHVQQVSTSERQCLDDIRTERDNQLRDVTQRRYSCNDTNRATFENGRRYYENAHNPNGCGCRVQRRCPNVVRGDHCVPPTFERSDVYGRNSFNTTCPHRVVENDRYGRRYDENAYNPNGCGCHVQRQCPNVVRGDHCVPPTFERSDVYGRNFFNTTCPHRVVENDRYGRRYDENAYNPNGCGCRVQRQDQDYAPRGYCVPPTFERSDVHGQNTMYTNNPYRVVENGHYGRRYNENAYNPNESGFHVQGQCRNTISTTSSPYHAVESGHFTLYHSNVTG